MTKASNSCCWYSTNW